MKRGTTQHPKTYTLAAVLDIPIWGAVGVLESLWHFTAKYSPAGDIGRFTDEDIARAIGWEGNAATLVSGLVKAGWADRCPCHRLRVHDWHEHADQYVSRLIKGKFLYCYQDPTVTTPKNEDTIAVSSGKLASQIARVEVDDSLPCRAVPEPSHASASARAVPDASPKPWSAEAIDDHRELRGEPSAGKVLSALKPVVDRYSWPEVRPVWRHWLSSDEGKFGAHQFAMNFLAIQAKFRGPPARASPKAQARQEAANAFIRGGLARDGFSVGEGTGRAGDLPPGQGTDGRNADPARKRLPGGTG